MSRPISGSDPGGKQRFEFVELLLGRMVASEAPRAFELDDERIERAVLMVR